MLTYPHSPNDGGLNGEETMTKLFEISPAPDAPWAVDKDTIVSGAGIPTHQKYCVRSAAGKLVAVMLTKDVADAIVSAVNACHHLAKKKR